jgi:hypothetical protein
MKYVVRGVATVSCWTEVEADSEEEALSIADGRELAALCHHPFSGEVDEAWHFENDGTPLNCVAESV